MTDIDDSEALEAAWNSWCGSPLDEEALAASCRAYASNIRQQLAEALAKLTQEQADHVATSKAATLDAQELMRVRQQLAEANAKLERAVTERDMLKDELIETVRDRAKLERLENAERGVSSAGMDAFLGVVRSYEDSYDMRWLREALTAYEAAKCPVLSTQEPAAKPTCGTGCQCQGEFASCPVRNATQEPAGAAAVRYRFTISDGFYYAGQDVKHETVYAHTSDPQQWAIDKWGRGSLHLVTWEVAELPALSTQEPTSPQRSDTDREVDAMELVYSALRTFETPARRRMLDWVEARIKADGEVSHG